MMSDLHLMTNFREFYVSSTGQVSSRLKSVGRTQHLYCKWESYNPTLFAQILEKEAVDLLKSQLDFLCMQFTWIRPYIDRTQCLEFKTWNKTWRVYLDGDMYSEEEYYPNQIRWDRSDLVSFILDMENESWKLDPEVKEFLESVSQIKPFIDSAAMIAGIRGLPDPGKIWQENKLWYTSVVKNGSISIAVTSSRAEAEHIKLYGRRFS